MTHWREMPVPDDCVFQRLDIVQEHVPPTEESVQRGKLRSDIVAAISAMRIGRFRPRQIDDVGATGYTQYVLIGTVRICDRKWCAKTEILAQPWNPNWKDRLRDALDLIEQHTKRELALPENRVRHVSSYRGRHHLDFDICIRCNTMFSTGNPEAAPTGRDDTIRPSTRSRPGGPE